MKYWLVKSEPGTYSWDDMKKDKQTVWDGIRNYQARNNLKAMAKGDIALFYHSGDERSIVGIVKIVKEAYPDPKDTAWLAVDLAFSKNLKNPVTLAQIKADKRLSLMALVKNTRLSVQPVLEDEFHLILSLADDN